MRMEFKTTRQHQWNYDQYYLDEYGKYYLPIPREYFDSLCHQYSRTPIERKLLTLGYLIEKGLSLQTVVNRYRKTQEKYVLDILKTTLIYYLQYMRWGECIHCTNILMESISLNKIIKVLQEEIALRYENFEYSNKDYFTFSNWDDTILEEMAQRANKSRLEFRNICTGVEFSKEFLNERTIRKT